MTEPLRHDARALNPPNDVLHRFQLERAGVRGAFVRLERGWQDLRSNGDYPPALGELLGQAVAASALFTSTIKFDGRLSVQLQGQGPLRLLFAECTHDGSVRGIARWSGAPPVAPIRLDPEARLAITIENRVTDTRYQGLVPVEGGDLAHAFENYFERSEQLPSRIVLAEAHGRCGGLLLQQVAREGGKGAADDDGWNRAGHLLATLTPRELLELAPEVLLLRLFHDEDVRLQSAQPLAFACTCSRERVEAMLRSLGRGEADATLAEQGSIEVHCEFCNRRYVFDDNDVNDVFGATDPSPPGATRH
ncbi:Hsp33 family molecular chaperone HslO [Dokdonella sp.]|uniref:Hsp33 family molecular chaperone HslO n=1 Tax=Dokdonella sp. TaxID=2291710 RepID=UPI002F3E5B5C